VKAHRVVRRRGSHSRLTDGGKFVSLTRRPPFTPRKIPGTHFYYRLSRPQGHSAAGSLTCLNDHLLILCLILLSLEFLVAYFCFYYVNSYEL
jgi:hypothetical protein